VEVGEEAPLTVVEPASLSVGGGDATLSLPNGSLLLRSRPVELDVDTEVVDIRPDVRLGEATRSLTAAWVLMVLHFLLVARLAMEPPLPLRSRPRNTALSLAAFATAAALATSMGSVIFGKAGTGGGGWFAGEYISSKLAKVTPDCPDWYNCRRFLNLSNSCSTVLPLVLVLLYISTLSWEAEP